MTYLVSLSRAAIHRRPSLLSRLHTLLALHRSRRELSRLDPSVLADIGVTREEADEEAGRSLWDVPQNWRL